MLAVASKINRFIQQDREVFEGALVTLNSRESDGLLGGVTEGVTGRTMDLPPMQIVTKRRVSFFEPTRSSLRHIGLVPSHICSFQILRAVGRLTDAWQRSMAAEHGSGAWQRSMAAEHGSGA